MVQGVISNSSLTKTIKSVKYIYHKKCDLTHMLESLKDDSKKRNYAFFNVLLGIKGTIIYQF